ncbi:putative Uncharacterized hydrolase [Glarea lozoyensis 74030]|uniref:Putative Uncharacterized hydrolase n=1 Tax=Glarea lozoyensis (strain ATCC 74030 / MF5533) TaxID=1104152 RepID=H0EK06_GLAL7|nr:putative Uncharacterized hydrolase [Glarea lozoyensis 74030]
MSESQLAALKIDRDRLWRDLHETCQWGKGERWGEYHDFTCAKRPLINTDNFLGVINWTNEEGARFPISMVASGVWADAIPLQKAYDLLSVGASPVTQKSELERIGYLGSLPASYAENPIGAHFELHIEQGPILEASGGLIGAVEGVQAYKWFTVSVKGKDCHTGTTDFANRSDALLTAAKLIVHSHDRASEMGCLASTGILNLKPGSTNTVPGYVQFSLDIRSKEDAKVLQLEELLKAEFAKIAGGEKVNGMNTQGTRGRGCTVEWQLDTDSPATKFHKDCIDCVERSAADMIGTENDKKVQRMTSGAGHDR